VWLDALTNYISALGYPHKTELMDEFWTAAHHIIGKDILRFHAVFWPAFLMAADLPLPKRIFAHGWWTNEGQKISKSLGNAIDPIQLVETFGLDPVRYFLVREIPFGQDGDFSRAQMIQRINGDLANDLGNLCQRVLSFIQKNAGGVVPVPENYTPEDQEILASSQDLLTLSKDHVLKHQAFHRYLEDIWAIVGQANRYIDHMAPWTLKREDPQRMATVLYVLGEVIRKVALLIHPVMPQAGDKILIQLGLDPNPLSFETFDIPLVPGSPLPPPTGIFPRFQETVS
jgi:methionyl-tRNA synthetase